MSYRSNDERRLPAASCDCHAHVFGPADVFPLAPEAGYQPAEASRSAYLKMLSTIGLTRMVIVQPSVYGFDNSCTVHAVASVGLDRARGIVMVPPTVSAERLRELNAAGMRGVRFITHFPGGPTLEALPVVAEAIAPLGWHIQMYVHPEELPLLEPNLRNLPVPMVLDHLGGLRASDDGNSEPHQVLRRLLDTGQCWVKLSAYRASLEGPPYDDVVSLTSQLLAYAPDRCVWGTDWPHPSIDPVPEDTALFDLLLRSMPDDETLRKVLVDNPASLYGFDSVTDS